MTAGVKLQGICAALALGVSLGACDSDSAGPETDCTGAKCDAAGDGSEQDTRSCFGVRGNGELIFAHFGSLARIYESYGLMWGASGGSSGSITTFLADSVQLNPHVTDCGNEACSSQEAGNRAALLFKSLQGYVGVLSETPEAMALQQLIPLAGQVGEAGIAELALSDVEAARASLLAILDSPDAADLINAELVELVRTSPDPLFHINDVVGALSKIAAFDASDDIIFVRPGVIDFEKFAEKIGRIADFYAGYGPVDEAQFELFLQRCATPGVGLSWDELVDMPVEEGWTCGTLFGDVLTNYRADALAEPDAFSHRIDEDVGSNMHTLISTSVLEGDAAKQWTQAAADYRAAQPHTLDIDFEDVGFGYFGSRQDLDYAEANVEGYDDLKTEKFRALGTVTWRRALTMSPAEPGLARAQELSDGLVSAGGWSDLHPTLVLRNLGCDEVIYVTRRGVTSSFVSHDRTDADAKPTGVATLLGMTDAQWEQLYDVNSQSAFDLSLREADAVWCTNWNEQSAGDIKSTVADAYNALLVSDDPAFTDGYKNHGDGKGIAGCASLVSDGRAD